MSATVIPLPANDTAGQWASGDARWLECPSCSAHKGVFSRPFGADVGDSVFTCSYCDGEALTAFLRKGLFHLLCMNCGVDHTRAIFGEN